MNAKLISLFSTTLFLLTSCSQNTNHDYSGVFLFLGLFGVGASFVIMGVLLDFFRTESNFLAAVFFGVSLCLIMMMLAACSTEKIAYIPTPIKRPVINLPIEPHYPIDDLTQADKGDNAKIAKAYSDSVKMCRLNNRSIRMQVRGNHD